MIRTVVPLIVAFVVTQAARVGLELDSAAVETLTYGIVTAVYYGVVRWLETRVNPAFGWLLGSKNQPYYS